MNDELLFEAGTYYAFPPFWNLDAPCPLALTEYKYKRFKDGVEYGIGRVFILGRTAEPFFRLLNNWNAKGVSSGYTYIAA